MASKDSCSWWASTQQKCLIWLEENFLVNSVGAMNESIWSWPKSKWANLKAFEVKARKKKKLSPLVTEFFSIFIMHIIKLFFLHLINPNFNYMDYLNTTYNSYPTKWYVLDFFWKKNLRPTSIWSYDIHDINIQYSETLSLSSCSSLIPPIGRYIRLGPSELRRYVLIMMQVIKKPLYVVSYFNYNVIVNFGFWSLSLREHARKKKPIKSKRKEHWERMGQVDNQLKVETIGTQISNIG